MTTTIALRELASVVRSKNAGPYEITYDVIFSDAALYEHVRCSEVLTRTRLAALYGIDDADITFCGFFAPALAFKFTHIRGGSQGGVAERDTFGAQQHGPLLDLQLPAFTPGRET
jgi:hypothetical protein